MRFAFIATEKASFPVALMCRMLAVSRAGFYAWRQRPVARTDPTGPGTGGRGRRDLRRAPRPLRQSAGAGRTARAGPAQRAQADRPADARSRVCARDPGGVIGPPRIPATVCRVSPNLLARRFTVARPNTAWVTDMTYIWTAQGWLYLAVIIDLFSRRVVGWSMSERLDRKLALDALRMALAQRRPPPRFNSPFGSR